MSDFSSAFSESFAIHSAISKALASARETETPVKLSVIFEHLSSVFPGRNPAAFAAAIISAAEQVGIAIDLSEAGAV